MNIQEIITKINITEHFRDYIEFPLKNVLNIDELRPIMITLNKNPNNYCLYNSKTLRCDNIGVVDVNDKRYIDFDDNKYTMTNKGVDSQVFLN